MARKKSNMTGGLISLALVALGAWFHKPLLDIMHKAGIAKNHA